MSLVAWVESPLQLVNAIEHAHAERSRVAILVRSGVPTLDAVADAVRPWLPPLTTLQKGPRSALGSAAGRSRELLAGDVHSGQLRAVLAAGGVRELVIVDDGAAMLTLADQLAHAEPLVRPANVERPAMQFLGQVAARRVRSLMRRGKVTIRTAYRDTDSIAELAALGAVVLPNDYEWTRTVAGRFGDPLEGTVVVGSAMVADGFISPQAYAAWLRTLAQRESVVYVPHRREKRQQVERYAEIAGVRVHRPGLALELVLAQQDTVARVVTLPSSVVATLARILPETVGLELFPIPDEWWTVKAPAEFRAMVRRVEESRWNT